MSQHLMIEKVIAAGEHHKTIDNHQVAPMSGLIHIDGLIVGDLMGQVGLNGPRNGHPFGLIKLTEPVVLGGEHG